jgi:arylsulfatase A-like enzyme
VAPRACRPQVLASPARVRLPVRADAREIDYFTHSAHGTRDWFRDNQPVVEEGYVTSLLGQDAVNLIGSHDPNTPLFLYLTFTAPHAPYQAPKEYLDRYPHVADPARRAYAAMITAMDDQIGRVLSALEKRGMRDKTLIVFQSDNGGPRSAKFTGEVDMSKSTIPADNGPYRDGKGTLYEGGTRVVGLANWPGHIQPGSVVDQPIHLVDMYPTLARLAGASLGKAKSLDGQDVWPTISEGKPSPRDELVYDIEPFRAAIRKGDWKLVWQATLPSRVELFDLAHDPSEDQPRRRNRRRSPSCASGRGVGARPPRPCCSRSARDHEARALRSVLRPRRRNSTRCRDDRP